MKRLIAGIALIGAALAPVAHAEGIAEGMASTVRICRFVGTTAVLDYRAAKIGKAPMPISDKATGTFRELLQFATDEGSATPPKYMDETDLFEAVTARCVDTYPPS